MNSYSVLSEYYERLMTGFDYSAYAEFVLSFCFADKCLDVACGTGRSSRAFRDCGLRVVGIDRSEDMLREAVKSGTKNIVYAEGSLETLSLGRTFPLVTVVNDGINYVAPQDIPSAFAALYAHTATGGTLAFDVSTTYKLRHMLGDNTFFEDTPTMTMVWRNRYSEAGFVEMGLTFFEKGEDGKYSRRDEEHLQYAHEVDFLKTLLTSVGFSIVGVFDGSVFAPIRDTSLRAIIIAKK